VNQQMSTFEPAEHARFQEMLACIPADDRDTWIKVAMGLKADFGDAGLPLWLEWSANSSKFERHEAERQWRGLKRHGGVTAGTVVALAREHGYRGTERPAPRANGNAHRPPADPGRPTSWGDVEAALLRQGYREVAVYTYLNADGTHFADKVRFEHPSPGPQQKRKDFRWRSKVNGVLMACRPAGGPIPPYGLGRILDHADQLVISVEGEKDANRLNEAGQVAISIEAGHETFAAEFLAGRDVLVIPDNDDAGEKRAAKVRGALDGVAASIRLLRLPGLPDKGDTSDWLDAGNTVSDLIELAGAVTTEQDNTRLAQGFTLFRDIDLGVGGIDVIDGVLPQTGVGALYAPSGHGKTFLTLDMGLSIGRGQPFAGQYETEPGAVAYVVLEAPDSVKRRVLAYKREHRVNDALFGLIEYPLDLGDAASVKGLVAEIAQLREACHAPVRLVVIDTLSQAMAGRDENSAKDVSLAIKHMKTISAEVGAFVLAVHHTGKDEGKGLRGSSALYANVDVVLSVSGERDDPVRHVHLEKTRDGEQRPLCAFTLEPRTVGTNARGRALTTAVIKYVEGVREARRRDPMAGLSSEQRAVLNHLDQIVLSGKSERFQGRDGIPDNTPAVALNDLVERCNQGLDVTKADKPHARRTSIMRNIGKLQERGWLHSFDGKVWKIRRVA
jgi:AAA domain/Primase C terminal 2 (PriCT-2)